MEGLGQITMLQVVDIGKIKTLSINFDPESGRVKKIVGKNGAGKSTALKTVEYALQGKKVIPNDAIRHGEYSEGEAAGTPITKGLIRLTTENGYIIERIIRKDKNGSQVEGLKVIEEGVGTVQSAQTFLTSMLSKYRSPQEIADKNSKELFSLLMDSLKGEIQKYDGKIAEVKEEASFQRKMMKQIGEPVQPAAEAPETLEDVEDIREELTEKRLRRQEVSSKMTTLESERNTTNSRLEEVADRITRLQRELANAEEERGALKERMENIPVETAQLTNELELITREGTALAEKVKAADDNRELIQEWKAYNEKIEQIGTHKSTLQDCADKVKILEEEKKKVLEDADLPISGLEVQSEEQEIWYNGSLWENVEESTRLIKALEMCIKTTPNGAPRIYTMPRGESIGKDRMKLLAEVLYKNDAYLLMEVMSDEIDGDDFIVIEEGDITIVEKEAKVEEKQTDPFGDLF